MRRPTDLTGVGFCAAVRYDAASEPAFAGLCNSQGQLE
jgi:hypothetical protein